MLMIGIRFPLRKRRQKRPAIGQFPEPVEWSCMLRDQPAGDLANTSSQRRGTALRTIGAYLTTAVNAIVLLPPRYASLERRIHPTERSAHGGGIDGLRERTELDFSTVLDPRQQLRQRCHENLRDRPLPEVGA